MLLRRALQRVSPRRALGKAFSTATLRGRVSVVGSGNWGTVAARIAAQNALRSDRFEDEVRMWVFEEKVDGSNLTDIINRENENVKYLPGIKLPPNLRAVPDLREAVEGADTIVFVTPHQFIKPILRDMAGWLDVDGVGAVSLIKGMDVSEERGFELMSHLVRRELGVECAVLMGANIAQDIGNEQFSEATVGSRDAGLGQKLNELFDTDYFHITVVEDAEGVEMCGTLKNIVALGAGFCDGLGLGANSKAAVLRIGLNEMKKLTKLWFPESNDDTFFESAGVADLIATCYGGRNRRCAEAFVAAGGEKSFDQIEAELLNGQKLQGVLTSDEVQTVLRARGQEADFPLFTTINKIVHGEIPPEDIVRYRDAAKK